MRGKKNTKKELYQEKVIFNFADREKINYINIILKTDLSTNSTGVLSCNEGTITKALELLHKNFTKIIDIENINDIQFPKEEGLYGFRLINEPHKIYLGKVTLSVTKGYIYGHYREYKLKLLEYYELNVFSSQNYSDYINFFNQIKVESHCEFSKLILEGHNKFINKEKNI